MAGVMVQRQRCNDNLHCPQISDLYHRENFFHECIYGASCEIQHVPSMHAHRNQFAHPGQVQRARCNEPFCRDIEKEDHTLQFVHDCPKGSKCSSVDPAHFILFNHSTTLANQPLPSCGCDAIGQEHNRSYAHICKDTACTQKNDPAHCRMWLHPPPFCHNRLNCPLFDIDQHHRVNYRHICHMGSSCPEKANRLHGLRFVHISATELPQCPSKDACRNPDPNHAWEYSHVCTGTSCSTGIEHRMRFYHRVIPISTFEGFWAMTETPRDVVNPTRAVTFQRLTLSDEYKMISDKLMNTIGGRVNIKSIERVINPALAALYSFEQRKVAMGNNDNPNELLMFHGSRNWKDILAKGFDFRFSNDSCRYGRGAYFAFNASYSNSGYVGQDEEGYTTMIVAHVLAGKMTETTPNSSLTLAPNGSDSVVEKGVMCIVYHDNRAYPSYLIRYKAGA